MIPINGHILIEPVEYESFIASQKETYEEKGVVLAVAEGITDIKVGWTVMFDSWLSSKFTDKNGKTNWLVPKDSIKAYEE